MTGCRYLYRSSDDSVQSNAPKFSRGCDLLSAQPSVHLIANKSKQHKYGCDLPFATPCPKQKKNRPRYSMPIESDLIHGTRTRSGANSWALDKQSVLYHGSNGPNPKFNYDLALQHIIRVNNAQPYNNTISRSIIPY